MSARSVSEGTCHWLDPSRAIWVGQHIARPLQKRNFPLVVQHGLRAPCFKQSQRKRKVPEWHRHKQEPPMKILADFRLSFLFPCALPLENTRHYDTG